MKLLYFNSDKFTKNITESQGINCLFFKKNQFGCYNPITTRP